MAGARRLNSMATPALDAARPIVTTFDGYYTGLGFKILMFSTAAQGNRAI